jgi:hypothetical protein
LIVSIVQKDCLAELVMINEKNEGLALCIHMALVLPLLLQHPLPVYATVSALIPCLLWEYHFWFAPAFSGTQVGRKRRVWCAVILPRFGRDLTDFCEKEKWNLLSKVLVITSDLSTKRLSVIVSGQHWAHRCCCRCVRRSLTCSLEQFVCMANQWHWVWPRDFVEFTCVTLHLKGTRLYRSVMPKATWDSQSSVYRV